MLSDHARSVANIQVIPDDRQRITVRRRLIWDDAKRALARPSFNPFIGLHIDFVGEGAQDAGGPLREFFHFLWSAVSKDGTIFTGSEDRRILTHNVISLQKEYYFLVGKCVALALVYGGTGPHFFSESVTSYIFNEALTIRLPSMKFLMICCESKLLRCVDSGVVNRIVFKHIKSMFETLYYYRS